MNNAKHALLLLPLLAGLSGLAHAQPAPGMGPGATDGAPTRMQERMQDRMQRRATDLKAQLKLSAEQEAAWTTYTAAMKPPANLRHPDATELAKLSTPERLDKMRELRQQHAAEMDKREQATRTFYATLTPEQKKTFDANTVHRFARRGAPRQN